MKFCMNCNQYIIPSRKLQWWLLLAGLVGVIFLIIEAIWKKGTICPSCHQKKTFRELTHNEISQILKGEIIPYAKKPKKPIKEKQEKKQPQFEPYLNKLVLGSLYLGGFVLILTLLLPTAYIERKTWIDDFLIWGWFIVYDAKFGEIKPHHGLDYFFYGIFIGIIIIMVSLFIMVETYRVNKGFININRCRTQCSRANIFCLAFQIFYLLYFIILGYFIPLPDTRSFINPTRFFYKRATFVPIGILISFIGNALIFYGIKMSKKIEGME